MFPTLSLHEHRQCAFLCLCLVGVVLAFVYVVVTVSRSSALLSLAIHGSPSLVEDSFSAHLKIHLFHLSHHRCCRKFAVRIEYGNEPPSYQVIYMFLYIGEVHGRHTCRNNSMMVSHFRRVEHSFCLLQWLSRQWSHQRLISTKSVERCGTFGIDIVAKELGIHTRISGQFLFIQPLNYVECHLGTHRVFLVTIHLQRRQVIQMWRLFNSVFLLHVRHGKRFTRNLIEKLLSLFLCGEFSLCRGKHCFAICC